MILRVRGVTCEVRELLKVDQWYVESIFCADFLRVILLTFFASSLCTVSQRLSKFLF